jgi:ribonuclease Z
MCVAFTGDGRPNSLTIKYAKGCDLVITEVQVELMAISAGINGVLPVMGRMTVDTSHNPGYAAGYLFNEIKPRLEPNLDFGPIRQDHYSSHIAENAA